MPISATTTALVASCVSLRPCSASTRSTLPFSSSSFNSIPSKPPLYSNYFLCVFLSHPSLLPRFLTLNIILFFFCFPSCCFALHKTVMATYCIYRKFRIGSPPIKTIFLYKIREFAGLSPL